MIQENVEALLRCGLGQKLKPLAKRREWRKKALAKAVCVTSRSMQLYEVNNRLPKNATRIIDLAHALGVETDCFLSTSALDRIRDQEAFLAEATDKYGRSSGDVTITGSQESWGIDDSRSVPSRRTMR